MRINTGTAEPGELGEIKNDYIGKQDKEKKKQPKAKKQNKLQPLNLPWLKTRDVRFRTCQAEPYWSCYIPFSSIF